MYSPTGLGIYLVQSKRYILLNRQSANFIPQTNSGLHKSVISASNSLCERLWWQINQGQMYQWKFDGSTCKGISVIENQINQTSSICIFISFVNQSDDFCCTANELIGFYVVVTLAFNGLISCEIDFWCVAFGAEAYLEPCGIYLMRCFCVNS